VRLVYGAAAPIAGNRCGVARTARRPRRDFLCCLGRVTDRRFGALAPASAHWFGSAHERQRAGVGARCRYLAMDVPVGLWRTTGLDAEAL
jgi:hypothetical protein